jgi:hypothetical protein
MGGFAKSAGQWLTRGILNARIVNVVANPLAFIGCINLPDQALIVGWWGNFASVGCVKLWVNDADRAGFATNRTPKISKL